MVYIRTKGDHIYLGIGRHVGRVPEVEEGMVLGPAGQIVEHGVRHKGGDSGL